MIEMIFLIVLALIWIIFATVQDLKKKEIANWLNFSLVIFALGFRFFYSLFSGTSAGFQGNFFYQGLIGLAIFFVLGNVLYYGKMFAGGDAKLMIALGPILGFSESLFTNIKIFVIFLFLFLFLGSIYGLIISLVFGLKNFKAFKKEFLKILNKSRWIIYSISIIGLFFMVSGFKNILFFIMGIIIFIFPLLFVYAKAVDESCMIKKVKSKELQEGDWLYKDLKIGKRIIKANWDGLNKEDIRDIKKKYKMILIRQGVPFTPVFLVSFLAVLYVYFYKFELLSLLFNF